jgi:hypothetical protein
MVLLAALLGLGGCIPMPYRFTLRPEVSGVILDAASSAPISNATVTCTTPTLSRGGTTDQVANSDASGRFDIPAMKRWGVYIMPMDYFFRPSRVVVAAPDHESRSLQVAADQPQGKPADLGDIRLKATP